MPSSTKPLELRIAVDTGGTFTDCVWIEHGRVRMLKVFSTPDDPSRAIAEAIHKIVMNDGVMDAGRPRPALILLHGTTVGTNTILQRKGARVAFVTTKGFEDIIEIGRQARPRLYDFFFDKVEPLVPPEFRFGVPERVTSETEILRKPLRSELEQLAQQIRSKSPQSIAISTIFSFANSANELAIASALKGLNLPLSISHQLLPEFREYERSSTVVVNAYLQPIMEHYLTNLGTVVGADRPRPAPRVFVMQSSGGITSLATAIREPVRTVLSGPAGGVVGAAAMARRSGFDQIISFDMGGTSTDVALVSRDLKTSNESEIAGLPVRVPMLDIHTVGAGGGSIARFDAGGALRVGPESAGADPGPICYGKGMQPTVTDANLLLGRLPAERFLGGDFRLDPERTRSVITKWLRDSRSNLTLERFAAGVLRVVNSTMEKAIRVVSIERGYDTRSLALVAFGGAGGLHACELAGALGISTVIVPALPGALSAYGILVSDVVKDFSRTILIRVSANDRRGGTRDFTRQLGPEYRSLIKAAEKEFREEEWKGSPRLVRSADLRYRSQGFELNVPFSPRMVESFHAEHKRRYGYSNPERDIEIVTIRLRAQIPSKRNAVQLCLGKSENLSKPEIAEVWFDGAYRRTTITRRDALTPGRRYRGPAVITEYSATTFVPPASIYQLDGAGNLLIRSQSTQSVTSRKS